MASNTPVPFQVVKSTAEKIAETIIPERVIVSDPVAKVTVIGDGVTKGGVPFGASEQWNKFYDGTLEELQTDPEAMAAFLKDAAGNGVLFVKVEGFINPDGTFDEEALKAWLEENYLKLTGGTLTGRLDFDMWWFPREELPENLKSGTPFVVNDAEGNTVAMLQAIYYAGGYQDVCLFNFLPGDTTPVSFGIRNRPDGKHFLMGPTPDNATAPDTALQTKKSVTDNFLPRTGGDITGPITIHDGVDLSNPPSGIDNKLLLGAIDVNNQYSARLIHAFHNGERVLFSQLGATIGGTEKYSDIAVRIASDGTSYATCPPPRGLNNNDIATMGSVIGYAPKIYRYYNQGLLHVFIDAVNGSDTADLHNGRGLSANMAFKTFDACWQYINTYIANAINIQINLLSDVECSLPYLFVTVPCDRIIIAGATGAGLPKHKLTFKNFVPIFGTTGGVTFYRMAVDFGNYYLQVSSMYSGLAQLLVMSCDFTGTAMYINVVGNNSILWLADGDITFNGTTHATNALINVDGGYVKCASGCNITGSVTGMRYSCVRGGRIFTSGKGVNFFPGTVAGTVDATSVYA